MFREHLFDTVKQHRFIFDQWQKIRKELLIRLPWGRLFLESVRMSTGPDLRGKWG